MAKISLIVPVFNCEKYLDRCIESIIGQVFSDFEVILIDDGSTDKSSQICDDYQKRDGRFRTIHQDNRGQAAARNLGVRLATAEWITFIDADDIIHPQFLELLYNATISNNVLIGACQAYEGNVLPDSFFKHQDCRPSLIKINENTLLKLYHSGDTDASKFLYWVVWGKIIHKSIISEYPFTENRIYEDNAVVFKWLFSAKNIVFCNNLMYFYYINKGGTTKKKYTLERLDWLWAVQEQIKFYGEINYKNIKTMLQKQYIWEALREYDHICNQLLSKKLARKLRAHIILYLIKNKRNFKMSYSEVAEVFTRLYPGNVKMLSRTKSILRQIFGCIHSK